MKQLLSLNKFSDWKATWDSFKDSENRWFNHSEFKPTGYYLKGGFSYLIYLNKNSNFTDLVIGQWKKFDNSNKNKTFNRYAITGKTMWITPVNSGMLYIADNNQTDLEIINITSNTPDAVIKVLTFKVNETNQPVFIQEIWTTKSPFIEFKSKHYFATMQTKMILKEVLPYLQRSFNEILLHWDNVWNWTNEVYGLNENSSNIHKKSSQYIHIANADSCAGYANASDGRLMFHNEHEAGKDLFLLPLEQQWGLWHETGHTYQTLQYMWDGLIEVTVNISALYIQQKMNLPLRIFETDKRETISNLILLNKKYKNSLKSVQKFQVIIYHHSLDSED